MTEKLIGYNGVTAHFTIGHEDVPKLTSLADVLPDGVTFKIEPSDGESPLRNNRQHLYIKSSKVLDIYSIKRIVSNCLKS